MFIVWKKYFGTLISVYGGDCDKLVCMDGYGNISSSDYALVDTVAAQDYHILVTLILTNQVGDYVLSINAAVSGDICKDAEDLGQYRAAAFSKQVAWKGEVTTSRLSFVQILYRHQQKSTL